MSRRSGLRVDFSHKDPSQQLDGNWQCWVGAYDIGRTSDLAEADPASFFAPTAPSTGTRAMLSAIKFSALTYLGVLLGPIALSLLRLARHRMYACDCGLPYELHRASSISVKVCAALRCSSMAWPAGESGGQSLRTLLSRQAMECPAHPARKSGKIKSPTRILHTIQRPED